MLLWSFRHSDHEEKSCSVWLRCHCCDLKHHSCRMTEVVPFVPLYSRRKITFFALFSYWRHILLLKCSATGMGFNGAETNCRIAHILGILLMNSCNTDIFFSNYFHLQSGRFECLGDPSILKSHIMWPELSLCLINL